jgi:transposase
MSPLYGMRVVARGLQKDLAAIRNGLTTKRSSCQVEGQNNRLKTLKRDMYGRDPRLKSLQSIAIPTPSQVLILLS